MSDSEYLHSSHNVSNLVYHFVTPVKYRRLARTEEVEGSLKQICAGIELRYEWIKFLEVGADNDHVHYLIQSMSDHSPSEIIKVVKIVTARRISAEHPEVKKVMGRLVLERRVFRIAFRIERGETYKRECDTGICEESGR